MNSNQVEAMIGIMSNFNLFFEMSKDGHHEIVKVFDQLTGKVIRQILFEEFIQMSKRIDDIVTKLSGTKETIFNSKV